MAVFQPPGECPVCGEDVPARSLACPACGADAATGWDEEATLYDGLDLPETGEPPNATPSRDPRASPAWWLWAALALLAALILAFFW